MQLESVSLAIRAKQASIATIDLSGAICLHNREHESKYYLLDFRCRSFFAIGSCKNLDIPTRYCYNELVTCKIQVRQLYSVFQLLQRPCWKRPQIRIQASANVTVSAKMEIFSTANAAANALKKR